MSTSSLEEAVSVGPAGIWDAETIAGVAATTFPLACPPGAGSQDIAAFVEATLSAENFSEYLTDPRRIVLKACVGDEIVGYLMAVDPASENSVDPASETSEPYAVPDVVTARPAIEISKLYVLPGHHGAGVSAALMEAIVDRAVERRRAGLWLGVNQEDTRARRFYQKHGFEVVGTRTFVVGSQTHDDFLMQRVL
ncbi:GNAT family N-acetyltransferase [Rhodococcus sp. (in: high G+C Gram-positive bacteria)]|uniref:GNAT family N-acetyltransferase n=1 Tax=Rhodococcus sp. TaxID=1831 RepID=UPI003890C3F1